ncbi:hypothetical protein [Psychrobacter fozii]|nr:hypothetical protein [Psychrobacter fozii]
MSKTINKTKLESKLGHKPMLIIKLTDSRETLDDIEKVCLYLTTHKELLPLINTEECHDISYILKPTFRADHNESEKKAHWEKVFNEFTLADNNGDEMRFYREKQTDALYFGTKKGFETLESINNDEPAIKSRFNS